MNGEGRDGLVGGLGGTPHDKLPARCQEVAAAVAGALALEEVAERHLAHADGCDECGLALEKHRAMAVVVARTRRALERARPDLAPERWVALRAAVDAATRRRRIFGFGLVGLATVAAVLLAVVLAPRPGAAVAEPPSLAEGGSERVVEGRALSGVGALALAPPRPSLREESAVEAGVPLVVAVGALLEAGPEGRVIEAFGRHRLELAAGASLRVRRFEPDGVELALEGGSATFEVKRRTEAEVFRVWSGDVAVSVRGTVFTVERLAAGASRVSVERGRVQVERAGTDAVAVSAGERVTFPAAEPVGAEGPVGDEALGAAVIDGVAGAGPGREANVRGEPGVGEAPREVKRRPAPRPEKVVEIDVGNSAMPRPPGDLPDVDNLIPPILQAVKAGRCVQALSALDELSRSVGGAMPRTGLWLTAYCQRSLGNVDASRFLFRRYGPSGPWAVPAGDELPPLP